MEIMKHLILTPILTTNLDMHGQYDLHYDFSSNFLRKDIYIMKIIIK